MMNSNNSTNNQNPFMTQQQSSFGFFGNSTNASNFNSPFQQSQSQQQSQSNRNPFQSESKSNVLNVNASPFVPSLSHNTLSSTSTVTSTNNASVNVNAFTSPTFSFGMPPPSSSTFGNAGSSSNQQTGGGGGGGGFVTFGMSNTNIASSTNNNNISNNTSSSIFGPSSTMASNHNHNQNIGQSVFGSSPNVAVSSFMTTPSPASSLPLPFQNNKPLFGSSTTTAPATATTSSSIFGGSNSNISSSSSSNHNAFGNYSSSTNNNDNHAKNNENNKKSLFSNPFQSNYNNNFNNNSDMNMDSDNHVNNEAFLQKEEENDAQMKLAKLREKIMEKKKQLELKAAIASTKSINNNNITTNGLVTPPPPPRPSSSSKTQQQQQHSNNNSNNPFLQDGNKIMKRIPKKKKQYQNAAANNNNNSSTATNADTTSEGLLVQPIITTSTANHNHENRNKLLAEKNAKRFATSNNSTNRNFTSMLPKDLQEKSFTHDNNNISSSSSSNRTNNNDNQQSQLHDNSLFAEEDDNPNNEPISTSSTTTTTTTIGLCQYKCPDEELLTREKENDIQLLEIPHPSIFPQHWTLRDTAIKRFRRSAADYTLNVPEWVRPPHVLESVCGYLEEWIYERDRQGIDPRFNQNNGGQPISPPPLDVYQFIWDRTRMIRKDFILQHYTGTGGKCNAIAVRCHERIARWHCMCEHQLSHLNDFITMQSQQNIQELGQTMKTLNLYYDDADGRATLEDDVVDVADNNNDGKIHGCTSDIVMGKNPIDYNGSPLVNDMSSPTIRNRIIGRKSETNGTAEPEMRGLYILLTINNDGGMEVLKYSSRLSQQNPEIFKSRPVQLALQVYKTRREVNYARFFSIMRSSSTPYLYACIMFKHVEFMRKAAFRIMSKTFGSKSKDTGKTVNDAYPLQDLVHLLCFEDAEEAKEACEHYNITVKSIPHPENPDQLTDVIFWKESSFSERRDATKGTVIKLQPRKMIRIIESKLNGATKLAVCRGEVSGIGATLDKVALVSPRKSAERQISAQLLERSESRRKKLEEERIQRERQLAEAERLAEQIQLKKEIQQRLEQEKIRLLEQEQKERERKEAMEAAARQREKEAKEAKEREEAERRKKIEAEQEALRREAEEKIRLEQERQRQEAERVRLKRELELKREQEIKQKAEEERLRKEETQRREEEERIRQIELKRIAAEQIKKQRELERLRLEEAKKKAEALRIEKEWTRKVEFAKKFIILQRWRAQLYEKYGRRLRTVRCLENLDPTKSLSLPLIPHDSEDNDEFVTNNEYVPPFDQKLNYVTHEEFFYTLSTDGTSPYNLITLLTLAMSDSAFWKHIGDKRLSSSVSSRITFLFKLGIYVPSTEDIEGREQLSDMIKLWIDSRLNIDHVYIEHSEMDHQVRLVSTFINESDSIETHGNYDAIMVIVPPTCADEMMNIHSPIVNTLQIKINLDDVQTPDAEEYDDLLYEGCKALFYEYASSTSHTRTDECEYIDMKSFIVERLSLKNMCIQLMKQSMWGFPDEMVYVSGLPSNIQREAYDAFGDRMIEYCFKTLNLLFDTINSMIETCSNKHLGYEFANNENNEIEGYFNQGEGLPMDWAEFGRLAAIEDALCHIFPNLEASTDLESFLQNLIDGAPQDVQGICGELFNDRQFRRCVESALDWFSSVSPFDYIFYLPIGMARKAIDDTLEATKIQTDLKFIEEGNTTAVVLHNGENESEQDNMQATMYHNEQAEQATKTENINDEYILVDEDVKNTREIAMLNNNKRSQPLVEQNLSSRPVKRAKQRSSIFDEDLKKSRNFTANLKALLEGDSLDMVVGDTCLSKILDGIDQ